MPAVAMLFNFASAFLVIGLGVRYDDRDQTPGLLVWVGVLMILPTWLTLGLIRMYLQQRSTAALRMAVELADLAKRHGSTTDVINIVEPMLPSEIRRDDGGDR